MLLACSKHPATAHAQVTVVVLLSQPTEFKGGINFFEPGWKGGDALLQPAVANSCRRWKVSPCPA